MCLTPYWHRGVCAFAHQSSCSPLHFPVPPNRRDGYPDNCDHAKDDQKPNLPTTNVFKQTYERKRDSRHKTSDPLLTPAKGRMRKVIQVELNHVINCHFVLYLHFNSLHSQIS